MYTHTTFFRSWRTDKFVKVKTPKLVGVKKTPKVCKHPTLFCNNEVKL